MTTFWGLGATPFRRHGSPFVRARSPLVPLCIVPHAWATAPSGRPFGCMDNVGPVPRLWTFSGCACRLVPPFQRPARYALQHTMSESSRAPGPPAGPGLFLVTDYRVSLPRNS